MLKQNSCGGIVLSLLAITLAGSYCGAAELARPAPLGIIVPAYIYPTEAAEKDWNRLGAAITRKVPLVVIINPASGPGTQADPSYQKWVKKIATAGGRPIGYIATGYGQREAALIEADKQAWLKFYPEIQGFFLDEQASDAAHVDDYLKLCKTLRAARPKGLIVSNPGTICDPGYFAKAGPDVICTFENSPTLAAYQPTADLEKVSPQRCYGLVHSQADTNTALAQISLAAENNIGWLYVTDDILPNPWDRLPPYWEDFCTALATHNKTKP